MILFHVFCSIDQLKNYYYSFIVYLTRTIEDRSKFRHIPYVFLLRILFRPNENLPLQTVRYFHSYLQLTMILLTKIYYGLHICVQKTMITHYSIDKHARLRKLVLQEFVGANKNLQTWKQERKKRELNTLTCIVTREWKNTNLQTF